MSNPVVTYGSHLLGFPPATTSVTTTGQSVDFLLRLRAVTAGTLEVTSANTASVYGAISNLVEDERSRTRFACRTLGTVIDALKVRESYNAHYRDFLTGCINEQQLEEAAAGYAYSPVEVPNEELAPQIDILLSCTTSEFMPSEVAELFHTRDDCVYSAMTQLSLPLGRLSEGAGAE